MKFPILVTHVDGPHKPLHSLLSEMDQSRIEGEAFLSTVLISSAFTVKESVHGALGGTCKILNNLVADSHGQVDPLLGLTVVGIFANLWHSYAR